MKKIFPASQSFFLLYPGLQLWFRFPAFISWLSISAGMLMCHIFTQKWQADPEMTSSFYIILICAATISLFWGILFKRAVLKILFFIIAGFLFFEGHTLQINNLYTNIGSLADLKMTLYGKIVSVPLPYPDNIRFSVKIDSTVPKAGFIYNKVIQYSGRESAENGSHVMITGIFDIPKRQKNPFEFDEYRFLLSNGTVAGFKGASLEITDPEVSAARKVSNHFRASVAAIINNYPDPDHRAILYATFLGETEYLSKKLKDSFRNSGIYHILSISGLHAALITAACYFLLGLMPMPIFYRHAIAFCTIWLYQIFIGFIPCLFRATVMATIVIFSFVFQKKNYPLQSAGIAGTIWLLWSPQSLFQAGYQLSFAATTGILTLYPVLKGFAPAKSNRFTGYLLSSLLSSFYISCAGIISTIPVLLYHFGNISLFGLISNIAAIPLMTLSMLCFFGALIFSAAFPQAVFIPQYASQFFLDTLISCADLSFLFPFSSLQLHSMTAIMTCLMIAGLIAVVTIKKKYISRMIIAATLGLSIIAIIEMQYYNNRQSLTLSAFSLDNGSMHAVRWPDNRVWLFVNKEKSRSDFEWLRTYRTWFRHMPYSGVDRIFCFSSAKRSSALTDEAEYENIYKHTITPDTTVSFAYNSRSFLYKGTDSCHIKNNNNMYFVSINHEQTILSFTLCGDSDLVTSYNCNSRQKTLYSIHSAEISLNENKTEIKHYPSTVCNEGSLVKKQYHE